MSNILGKHLLRCSDNYNEQKHSFDSFEDFFSLYLKDNCLNDDVVFNTLQNFLSNDFLSINNSTSDEHINNMIHTLKETLLEKNAIKESCDLRELIGYILLGNLIKR